ncbi:MAG: DUF2285 domain-containing protein [Aestuariivirga sp.]
MEPQSEANHFKAEGIRMVPSFHRLEIAVEPPESGSITAYDRAHFATYLSLLYAAGEGENDLEMARNILMIDPEKEPHRARQALESHLKRARWLAESGYQSLLEA